MTPTDPIRSTGGPPTCVRYWVLAVLCSMAFLTYLDRICIMRVQGEIERDLEFAQLTGADEQVLIERGLENDPEARAQLGRNRATQRMSWVFSAFLMGYLLFEIPGGWLGDRWGARAVILRIVLWWSFFTALTGSIDSVVRRFHPAAGPALLLGAMVLVRFSFGLGEAGAYPNIARALGRWFPFRERAAAQGAIWMSSRFGGALAPTIIGGLMSLPGGWGGWRQAFWILGLVGIVWAVFFWLWFRNTPEEKPSVNLAESEWIRADASGPDSIYNDQSRPRLPWRRLIFSRNLFALYLVSFSMSFSWYFYVTFLPKFLKDQFGVDYSASQIMSGLPLLMGGLACLVGGRFSDYWISRSHSRRWGRSLPGVIGCTIAGFCALAVTQLQSPWAFIAVICTAAAAQDLALPCMWSAAVDLGDRYAGTVGGCMNSMGAIGGMLSPLIAAQVSIAFGWPIVFVLFAGTYFLAAVAWSQLDASQSILGHACS